MQTIENEHRKWMEVALKEAKYAFEHNEVPIGAIIVHQGQIVGKGHNSVERLKDTTAHAEMIALTAAMETLGTKFLSDCTLYVTIEPCLMCMGAILHARIPTLVYGAPEPKMGFFSQGYSLPPSASLQVFPNVESEKSKSLMQLFFQRIRSLKK